MGLVSIPGTAGEEVNAALLRTATVSKYRDLVIKREQLKREIDYRETIIDNFEQGYIERKRLLIDSGNTPVFEELGSEKTSLSDRVELLIAYKSEWEDENLEYYVSNDRSSEAGNGSKSSKNNDYYEGRITPAKVNRAIYESNEKYILYCYLLIKATVVNNLNIENNAEMLKKVKIDQEINNLKPAIESEILYKEINELERRRKKLEQRRYEYSMALQGNYVTKPTKNIDTEELKGQGVEIRDEDNNKLTDLSAEELYKGIGIVDKEIGELNEKERELKDKLKAAEKREEENPVWESAVFIVIAFFSGYSINFVTKMFDRAMTAIISGKPGATEMEGEAPHEPEAGGEEAAG
jgi:hypothetical protein